MESGMSHNGAAAQHVTDEELLLEYYGEGSPDRRAVLQAHLEACVECRALDRELRGVLALVDSAPLPEPPAGFEQEMWVRLEPLLASRVGSAQVVSAPSPAVSGVRRRFWTFDIQRWAFAGGVAALAVVSFALGRVWDGAPAAIREPAAMDFGRERLVRSEVEEHLERSQRVLLDVVNADDSPNVFASGRAADLVADGRLYRQSVEALGDAEIRDLLQDVERVLVEVANGPAAGTSNDLSGVRARISDQDLLFRLRVVTMEMRERDRRARPTW